MAHNYTRRQSKKTMTPQTEPIPGREADMTANSAGGFSFALDKWKRLERFLILGSESSTYYISQRKLTKDNIKNSITCIKEDAARVLTLLYNISIEGRAHKNDPAIMLLAVLFSETDDKIIKNAASRMFPKICRTGTHMFTFAQYVDDLRSWGRSIRSAIGNWYSMDPQKLEYQMVKYAGRTVEGTNNQWTHKDVLRSAHIKPSTPMHAQLFKYAVKNEFSEELPLISATEELKSLHAEDIKRSIKLISEHKIPQDAWPTEIKNNASVWEAALQDIPLKALIRNLNRLTSINVLDSGPNEYVGMVESKITDEEYLKKSRIHPMDILLAQKTYSLGHGIKGSLKWTPVQKIVDALEAAFYLSFKTIEPSGKRMLLGLDVSGSMSFEISSGILSCAECSALMAMVTARSEKEYTVMAFNNRFQALDITPEMRFEQILRKVSHVNFGGTDCSLPMVWAKEHKYVFDAFIVYTDNETYAGNIQPVQALKQYRSQFVHDARLIVVGMNSNGFSIADPNDAGMLDIVGFDANAPRVISDFVAGKI